MKASNVVAAVLIAALIGALLIREAPAVGAGAESALLPEPTLPPIEGSEMAVLVAPPAVPPAITRDHATRVVVELETVELTAPLSDRTEYRFWTFRRPGAGQLHPRA
jgi:nitrite reductase (NO-forming)